MSKCKFLELNFQEEPIVIFKDSCGSGSCCNGLLCPYPIHSVWIINGGFSCDVVSAVASNNSVFDNILLLYHKI